MPQPMPEVDAADGASGAGFWTDETSVVLTSFWGWRPERWAAVGWTGEDGRTYRDNFVQRVTNPFITVVYVARSPDGFDRDLVDRIAGFYLVSHEAGHRNEFTHPSHHRRDPDKWEHSLRAIRAFSYVLDPLPLARDVEPAITRGGARAIARWGKVLTDLEQIRMLRDLPWRESPIYRGDMGGDAFDDVVPPPGFVPAGPQATRPYVVSPNAVNLPRHLYVLRLDGDTDAYLGSPAGGRRIVKIGLSVQPAGRCRDLQKHLPRGVFRWVVDRPRSDGPGDPGFMFDAAVVGENAMKTHLVAHAENLGGEFYLADDAAIETAWRLGHDAARTHADSATL